MYRRNRLKYNSSTCAICIPVFFPSYRYYLTLRWIWFIFLNEFKVCLWSGSALNEGNLFHNAVKRNKKCFAENRLHKCSERSLLRNDRTYCFDHKLVIFFSWSFPAQILGHAFNPVLLYCGTFTFLVGFRSFSFLSPTPKFSLNFSRFLLVEVWRRVHTDILHKWRLSLPLKKKGKKNHLA